MKPVFQKRSARGASRKQSSRQIDWRAWRRGISLAAFVCLALLVMFAGGMYLDRALSIPVAQVGFAGGIENTDRNLLVDAVRPHLETGFFQLDLEAVSESVEKVEWVYQAQVARRWPGSLTITIVEQRPIARWGDSALISHRGDVFLPAEVKSFSHLPVLHGPDDQSAVVMERYLALSSQLEREDMRLDSLRLDDFGSWTGVLSSGVKLNFGAGDMMAKMQRFLVVYRTSLKSSANELLAVDMRYSNGLAVAWRHLKPKQS